MGPIILVYILVHNKTELLGFYTWYSSKFKSQQPKYYLIWKDSVTVFGLNICLNN